MTIIRTKTKAYGGITEHEKRLMEEHAKLWIARALRTEPIEPDKIIPAIEGIYAAAGLKKPRIVIVPSPLVMAFAYGAAAAIWYGRKQLKIGKRSYKHATDWLIYKATYAPYRAAYEATEAATCKATRDATDAVTAAATLTATFGLKDFVTHEIYSDTSRSYAAYSAVNEATEAAICEAAYRDVLTNDEIEKSAKAVGRKLAEICTDQWESNCQAYKRCDEECYLSACRDILGLDLPEYKACAHWEQAAIHGGPRIMHEEFCMVSDSPEIIRLDAQNRAHCETGPSLRWRDGWSLYSWHGQRIPAEWIEDRNSLTPAVALGLENLELRRTACEMLGWTNILDSLNAEIVDSDPDPQIGTLVEVELPGRPSASAAGRHARRSAASLKAKFLRVKCGTGREFAVGIPPHITKALDAQAWMIGLEPHEFQPPEIRT